MGDTGCRFNRIPSQIRGVHTATSWIRLLILETKVPRQKLDAQRVHTATTYIKTLLEK